MVDVYSLGKKDEFGKIDFSKLKSGLTKAELGIEEGSVLASIFDSIDTEGENTEGAEKGKLSRNELVQFINKVKELAGKDNNLSEKEAKGFKLDEKNKLGGKNKKELFNFLQKWADFSNNENQAGKIVEYIDGHTEEIFDDGSKIITVTDENNVTKKTKSDKDGNLVSETVTNNESETVTEYSTDKKATKETILNKETNIEEEYDLTQEPKKLVKKTNKETGEVTTWENGNEIITRQNGTQTKTTTKQDENNYTTEITDDNKKLSQTKVIDGQTYEVKYDGKGNTIVVVQANEDSIEKLATQFGCKAKDLVELNPNKLIGKAPHAHFKAGEEIVVPKEIEADSDLLKGRKDSEGAIAEDTENKRIEAEKEEKRKAEIARKRAEAAQRRAEQREQRRAEMAAWKKACKPLGIKNTKKYGQRYTDKNGNKYTIVGEAAYARIIVKDKKGKVCVFAHDGVMLKQEYVQTDIAMVRSGKKRIVINNRAYYTDGKYRDKHCRVVVQDWTGKTEILSGGGADLPLEKRVVLNKGYVQASDARDYAVGTKTVKEHATFSKGTEVTQYKDKSGKVWYFDEKTGRALVKGDYSNFVNKEAKAISDSIYDAAEGIGTKNDQLKTAISYIQSPTILAKVNANIEPLDSDYKATKNTTALEALILDEDNHQKAQEYFGVLIQNGAMTRDQAATCITREMEHELHGRTLGYTSTEGIERVMGLVPEKDRNLRIAVEAKVKENHPELKADDDSFVRAYIKADDWDSEKVDLFDAIWVQKEAYAPATYKRDEFGEIVRDNNGDPVIEDMGDQKHRNKVIERLCFDYDDKETLHAGLKAINDDPQSQDYINFSQRAAKENKKRNYVQQFTDQESVQQYLAGRATDEGSVDVGQLKACNNLLFKSEKPARVRAEEALYKAKEGDMTQVFESMDPEVYAEQQAILQKGDIKGCKNLQEVYKKAMTQADKSEKVSIKANAIISNQVPFKHEEIVNFTIELMHEIDKNNGLGNTSGISGGYKNDAEAQKEQLKAILRNHPEIKKDVLAKFKDEKFEYSYTRTSPDSERSTDNVYTVNTKQDYLNLINSTNTVADEAVFIDENGNKITDPQQIEMLKNANLNSLQGLRNYVASLEREFKTGVDAEGSFTAFADFTVRFSGVGTDRGDVANQYRYAKNLLRDLELAAQGKLRDGSGKVISAQKLAEKAQKHLEQLAQTNQDYQTSVNIAKMGVTLLPVIIVTTVATGGAASGGWLAAAAGGSASAGWVAAAAGGATLVTEGAIQTTELLTSETGNTARNRAAAAQQVLWDTALAATSVKVGQLAESSVQTGLKLTTSQITKANNILARLQTATTEKAAQFITKQTAALDKIAPRMNPATKKSVATILARTEAAGVEVTSDTVQSLLYMYCQEGEFNEQAFTQGLILSAAGNTIGHVIGARKDLKQKTNVLDHATENGTRMAGGPLNKTKMEAAREEVRAVAQKGTPENVAHTFNEADLLQSQTRPQGRELKQILEDEAGYVSIGKERISLESTDIDALNRTRKEVSSWADGTRNKEAILAKLDKQIADVKAGKITPTSRSSEIVTNINENVSQNAENILAGRKGAIGSPDAATLRDQLVNNLKTESEIEEFITNIRKRVGVDEKGNMHVYQVQGKDHAADLVNMAEKKLKEIRANKANLQEATEILDRANTAGKGLSEDELKTLKSVAGKITDPEELRGLLEKMKSNPRIKKHSGAKEIIAELEERVKTPNATRVEDIAAKETEQEGIEVPSEKSGEQIYDFMEERQRLIEEGKLNPDGTPIEARQQVEKETEIEVIEISSENPDKRIYDFQEERQRMINEGRLNPDGTPIEVRQKVEEVIVEPEAIVEPKVVVEPEVVVEAQVSNTPKSYSEMNEGELFNTYNELKEEVNYSPLNNSEKAAKIKEMKKIEATLKDKGFEIENNELVSTKNKTNNRSEKVNSEHTPETPKITKKSVLQKYGEKVSQMYDAAIRSIENLKTITDFNRINAYISRQFSKYTDLLNDLRTKLITKAKSIGLTVKDFANVAHSERIMHDRLSKYKRSEKGIDLSKNHEDWASSRRDLFGGTSTSPWWSQYTPLDQHHAPWKMHLYSVDEADWREMCDVIIPYLKEHDICWKTLNRFSTPEELSGNQMGKAFTIYPRDNTHMEQVAKDLDYIIRKNKLTKTGSHIIGDNEMGSTGRLFYRYEYNSGKYKNEILDLNTDYDKYKTIYDRNRGEGRYLAADMTEADDIWRNFDPSNLNSHFEISYNDVKKNF